MTRCLPAFATLLALAVASCSGGDGGADTRALFPLASSAVTQGAGCGSLRAVELAGPASFEAGTITTVRSAGTFGLSPEGVPLRLTLGGSGDYFVTTYVTTAFGTTTTTFSARGLADGVGTRQWTLTGPAVIQLNPLAGGAFVVAVCPP